MDFSNKSQKISVHKNNISGKYSSISCCSCKTPAGELTIISNGKSVKSISFVAPPEDIPHLHTEAADLAVKELNEYFAGKRLTFNVPLEPDGTPFQKLVWKAITGIPYGQTMSYKQIAEKIGSPKACRAVGQANGRNPIPIIIPCHRVIGNNGSLTGYEGGLKIKRLLLMLEKENLRKLRN